MRCLAAPRPPSTPGLSAGLNHPVRRPFTSDPPSATRSPANERHGIAWGPCPCRAAHLTGGQRPRAPKQSASATAKKSQEWHTSSRAMSPSARHLRSPSVPGWRAIPHDWRGVPPGTCGASLTTATGAGMPPA